MNLLERLRKPDWLRELLQVLVVCLVVVGGFGLFVAVDVGSGESITVELPASGVDGVTVFDLRDGVVVADDQDLAVVIADPSLGQRVAWVFASLPSYAVVVAVLALLVWIVRHARRGDPFTLATVRRLRLLAVVTLGGFLASLVEAGAELYLSGTVASDGLIADWSPSVHWLLAGFGLFAVAEIIKRGCAMRAELETVV